MMRRILTICAVAAVNAGVGLLIVWLVCVAIGVQLSPLVNLLIGWLLWVGAVAVMVLLLGPTPRD